MKRRDLGVFLGQLRRGGYDVQLAKSGHYKIRDGRGRLVAVTGSTPGDRRALMNLRARLKRNIPAQGGAAQKGNSR